MSHNVERRAQESSRGQVPAGPAELREPFHRVRAEISEIGRERRANAGLTKRERKVKHLLLRELKKSTDTNLLSYDEIQHLQKTLDVDWVDAQLAKMRAELKSHPRMIHWAAAIYGILAVLNLVDSQGSGQGAIISLVWLVAAIGVGFLGPIAARRSIRRKVFIYEALRELAGPDEAGVTLDQAVRDADDLITRIVDMELAAEAKKPAKSIGRVRNR